MGGATTVKLKKGGYWSCDIKASMRFDPPPKKKTKNSLKGKIYIFLLIANEPRRQYNIIKGVRINLRPNVLRTSIAKIYVAK